MDRKATPSASTRTTRRAVDRLTLAKWALAAALLGAFAAYLWSNSSELGRLRDISGATASYVLAARLIAYWAQASATPRLARVYAPGLRTLEDLAGASGGSIAHADFVPRRGDQWPVLGVRGRADAGAGAGPALRRE